MNNIQQPKIARARASRAIPAGTTKSFLALVEKDRDLARAWRELNASGQVTGSRSRKISTRVDPGVLDAAKKRFGVESDADVINAALALAAERDTFNEWLLNHKGRLSDDFELAI